MATGQTILDTMEVVNQELQLQSGESDVARGLVAANRAQDFFESLAAQRKGVLGESIGTVTTTLNTERTAFPSGVLRVDRLQYIDPGTSMPVYDLTKIASVGGHAIAGSTPYWLQSTVSSTGLVSAYWTNGTYIYWAPTPAGVYTIRWYGFQRAADITASGTFAYDDGVILPIAVFAAKLLKLGLDDPQQDYDALAQLTFKTIIDTLQGFNRDGASPLIFARTHTE